MALTKLDRRTRIKRRIRKRISGTTNVPRLSVFRSNRQISVQLIDDNARATLLSASSLDKDLIEKKEITKTQKAELVGKLIAEKALEKNISEIVFDRNGYLYHGRVKALAESARKHGLKF